MLFSHTNFHDNDNNLFFLLLRLGTRNVQLYISVLYTRKLLLLLTKDSDGPFLGCICCRHCSDGYGAASGQCTSCKWTQPGRKFKLSTIIQKKLSNS